MSTVELILIGCDKIYALANECKINKKRCKRLCSRLKQVEEPLKRIPEDDVHSKALARTKIAVDRAAELVETYKSSKWYSKLQHAATGAYRDQFDDVNQDLRDCLEMLHLEIAVSMWSAIDDQNDSSEDMIEMQRQLRAELRIDAEHAAERSKEDMIELQCALDVIDAKTQQSFEEMKELNRRQSDDLNAIILGQQDVKEAMRDELRKHHAQTRKQIKDLEESLRISRTLHFRTIKNDDVVSSSASSRIASIQEGAHSKLREISAAEISKSEQLLGEGSFGKVLVGSWKGDRVALKMIDTNSSFNAARLENLLHEARVHHTLKHPHILTCYGYVSRPLDQACIVLELATGGTLYNRIHNNKRPLSPALSFALALDICHGLNYLHHRKLFHRDLKSLNVLITLGGILKIADFGLAKIKEERRDLGDSSKSSFLSSVGSASPTGTHLWMAPETFVPENKHKDETFYAKVDVYAYAIILFELATREVPWKDCRNQFDICFKVRAGDRPKIREEVLSSEMVALIRVAERCWAQDPKNRPYMVDIQEELRTSVERFGGDPRNNDFSLSTQSTSVQSTQPTYLKRLDTKTHLLDAGDDGELAFLEIKRRVFGDDADTHSSLKWKDFIVVFETIFNNGQDLRRDLKDRFNVSLDGDGDGDISFIEFQKFFVCWKHNGFDLEAALPPLKQTTQNSLYSQHSQSYDEPHIMATMYHLSPEQKRTVTENIQFGTEGGLWQCKTREMLLNHFGNPSADALLIDSHVTTGVDFCFLSPIDIRLRLSQLDSADRDNAIRVLEASGHVYYWAAAGDIIKHVGNSSLSAKLTDLTWHDYLGRGAFGVAHRVTDKRGTGFAVKFQALNENARNNLDVQNVARREDVQTEAAILASMNSPGIIRVFDYGTTDCEIFYTILELCEGGTLNERLRAADSNTISPSITWRWIKQIASGLYDLHSARCIHRDVKSSNIFLTKRFDHFADCKIGDLGNAKVYENTDEHSTTVGTRGYMAPEVIGGGKYSSRADVWSFFIVVVEALGMIKGQTFQWVAVDPSKLAEKNAKILPPASSREGFLIHKLMVLNDSQRPSADQVYNQIIPAAEKMPIHNSMASKNNHVATASTWSSNNIVSLRDASATFDKYIPKGAGSFRWKRVIVDRGNFGQTLYGAVGSKDQDVAVKLEAVTAEGRDILGAKSYLPSRKGRLRDWRILQEINSIGVLRLLHCGVASSDIMVYSIFEYEHGGSLETLLRGSDAQESVDSESSLEWVFCLIQGLKDIHSRDLIHRNIHLGNCFISSDRRCCKLGDVGVITADEDLQYISTMPALEIINGEVSHKSKETDVWDLGVVSFELLIQKPLNWRRENLTESYLLRPMTKQYGRSTPVGNLLRYWIKVRMQDRPTAQALCDRYCYSSGDTISIDREMSLRSRSDSLLASQRSSPRLSSSSTLSREAAVEHAKKSL